MITMIKNNEEKKDWEDGKKGKKKRRKRKRRRRSRKRRTPRFMPGQKTEADENRSHHKTHSQGGAGIVVARSGIIDLRRRAGSTMARINCTRHTTNGC